MKKILFILCLLSFKAYAQEPTYVPMKSNYLFRGIKMDSLLIAPVYPDTPTATTKVNFAGSVVRVGSKLYMRNPQLTKWVDLSDGGALAADTTSLSNRINNKVDSVTKVSDSVKYWKNGTSYFAFNDSSGGGNLTLNQVTDFGNTTQNNIIFVDDADLEMDTLSSILLANNSRLQQGTIDAGYGGNKGIAQICGLGYELKWEGGRLFSMGSSGNTIREAKYMFGDIPTSSDDNTKGYYVGSRWVLDNGNTYVCTDASTGAAVWVLQSNTTDTTSLSNRINDKIDSLRRVGTQVSFKKNGTWYNAYTDSVGAGQNGRWGNDTAMVILAKVHNSTATTLTRGTAVMISGAVGDVAAVIRANNKYDSTSARTIGLVKDPINAGDTGYVVTQGQASKLTLGSYTAGDVLYLDSIDGGLTKTKPIAPYHEVFVCIVERANNGNGLAYVKPQNGLEIEELHDVRIITPLNNQVLVYSDTQQLWKNRNVYSVVDTTSLSNRINTLTLDSVAKKGNASSVPIYVYEHLGITDASAGGDGKINYDNYEYYFTNQDDEEILKFYKNTLILLDSAGNTATIKTLNNNADLTITLPDVSGQLLTYTTANAQYLNKGDTTNMLTNYQRTSAFPIATFGAGSGAAGDTSAFTTVAIYGSFYNSGVDTIIVTSYVAVLQGTSPSITPTIYFNDTLNATAVGTKIVNSPSAVTSTTLGNTVTSLDNTKIPPGNFVWVKTETVTTKPTYFSLTLIGYRKRP